MPITKRIYCANNNKIYASGAEAARELNLDRSPVCKAANGDITHVKYYVFRYVDADEDLKALRKQMLYNAFKIKI